MHPGVRLALVVPVAILVAACGDDGEPPAPPPTTAAASAPATLPDEVDPGRGALVLGGERAVLTVTACTLEASTDESTGVTTEVLAGAEDGTGRVIDVIRSSFAADLPTVTDTVRITDQDGSVVEASRADRDGLLIDLRVANPVGRLLEVDVEAGTIRAEGVFGPVGTTVGEPGNVDGELLLRCPSG